MGTQLQTNQRIVLVLTIGYFFTELIGGLYYHSIALTTDASFMAINITGQLIAIYVERLAKRIPDKSKTFGYERAKVLSGLFNGMLVGFIVFYVFIEAYQKILHPQPLEATKILIIAVMGLFVNAFGLIMLYKHCVDINVKGSLLLILNDTLGSVGVILSAIIITFTHLYFVDAIAGIMVGLLAAYPTYFLIKDSIEILMEGNYTKIDIEEVEDFIKKNFSSIKLIKDMHVWALSNEVIIMVFRIRTNGSVDYRNTLRAMKRELKQKFGFSDIYIEGYEGKAQPSTNFGCL